MDRLADAVELLDGPLDDPATLAGNLRDLRRINRWLGGIRLSADAIDALAAHRDSLTLLDVGTGGADIPMALLARAGQRVSDTEFRSWEHYEDVPPAREKAPTAFVTVQRGCDYRCTFCIVPHTRGPERSRKLTDVVREVTDLVEQGTTEVTLLGQTVNSYHDGQHDFGDLLQALGKVAGLRRIRFTSPYPTDFTPRVIAAMAATPAVCEHVHLPVQSGSNAVLKRMLRRYTRERYLGVVAELRESIPGITLSTDVIVGFPGETEADFEDTLSLVAEAGFDDAYTFKYSVREGTPAVRLKDHVPDEVASGRLHRLIEAVRSAVRRKNIARVGETHEVLVERPAKRGELMLGRTRTNQLVLLELPSSAIGQYHTVRLSGTTGSTFTGSVVTPTLAVL
jgi:tRNA-2-methylthio-N6-dimethylallyladenosine synthase